MRPLSREGPHQFWYSTTSMGNRDNWPLSPTTAVRKRSLRTACPIGIAAKPRKWPAISNPERRNKNSCKISHLGGGEASLERTRLWSKFSSFAKNSAFGRDAKKARNQKEKLWNNP